LFKQPANSESVGRRYGAGNDSTVLHGEETLTYLNMVGFNPEDYTPAPPTSLPADGIDGEGWEPPGCQPQNAAVGFSARLMAGVHFNNGSLSAEYDPINVASISIH